jgi:hypothetical protein
MTAKRSHAAAGAVRVALACAAFACAAFACATVGRAAPTARELERVLGGYEHAPTADEVRRLGAGADVALMNVAADAHWPRIRRVRAIAALRFVPSVAARDWLRSLAEDKRASCGAAASSAAASSSSSSSGVEDAACDALELAAALSALQVYDGQAPLLLSFVAHASADVREAAAAALAGAGARDAEPILRARVAVERDAGVRATLTRALATLRAR